MANLHSHTWLDINVPSRIRVPPYVDGVYSDPSSPDSGYASECSPQKRPGSRSSDDDDRLYTLDGAQSPEHGHETRRETEQLQLPRTVFVSPVTPRRPATPTPTPAQPQPKPKPKSDRVPLSSTSPYISKSLPRPGRRARTRALAQAVHPGARPASKFGSLRGPHRFIHPRGVSEPSNTLTERYRLTKSHEHMTARERIARNNSASQDAFARPSYRFNPVPTLADLRQSGLPTQAGAISTIQPLTHDDNIEDEPIEGSVWAAGTQPPLVGAVDNGAGTFSASGTAAPLYISDFIDRTPVISTDVKHTSRLAAALNIDRTGRILSCRVNENDPARMAVHETAKKDIKKTTWNGYMWVNDSLKPEPKKPWVRHVDGPAKILSAVNMRDDYYATLLAFCPVTKTLAMALSDLLYIWTERTGSVHINGTDSRNVHLTSMAFSSNEGRRSILAFGRSNGSFGLMALAEANTARIVIQEESAISCMSWRPTCTMRPSKNPSGNREMVSTEDLLIGVETGFVLYYVVEWPHKSKIKRGDWCGDISLVARIEVHKQQVCGLAWSPDGAMFATGSNDNVCALFHVNKVLINNGIVRDPPKRHPDFGRDMRTYFTGNHIPEHEDEDDTLRVDETEEGREDREFRRWKKVLSHISSLPYGSESRRWVHAAAVKAIAFCPWQDGLVATGGGMGDQCIHFHHAGSGAALASIFVGAQVTGLVWSLTRREISATFGYATPGHRIKVAVYSWPECRLVIAIPWDSGPEARALTSVSCQIEPALRKPRQPPRKRKSVHLCKRARRNGRWTRDVVLGSDDVEDSEEDSDGEEDDGEEDFEPRSKRNAADSDKVNFDCGVVVVASCKDGIKFYELWPESNNPVGLGVPGMLGGSGILEDLEGVHKDDGVIR